MRFLFKHKAVTLLELLIALILVAIVAVSIFSLDLFGRYHIVGADRRRRVQNQVSDVLERISKSAINAIGNALFNGGPVDIHNTAATKTLAIYVDEGTGGDPGDGVAGTGLDHWVAYRYNDTSHTMQYCAEYNDTARSCGASAWVIIGKNISFFEPSCVYGENFIGVNVSGCWNPDEADTTNKYCGSPDNPSVSMNTRFEMPSMAYK